MRYYRIEITNADTGAEIAVFTSFVNGRTIPGALNIQLDIPVFSFDAPMGGSFIRVWGVSLQTIGQANNMNGATVKVFAGMQKGLPLANPAQAGLIASGSIQQAFGNWQGTQQSLDMIVMPNTGSYLAPVNLIFDWQSGQQMGSAIKSTLATAFPGSTIEGSVSDALTLPYNPQQGYYESLGQFSQYVRDTSKQIIGGNYSGVKIIPTEAGFKIYDGTSETNPTAIKFTDLIGQPTWNGLYTVNFKTVLRSDLEVGEFITMPPGQQTVTAQTQSQYRQKSDFQGKFQINQIRHLGDFRQRDAGSWVTVIDAAAIST